MTTDATVTAGLTIQHLSCERCGVRFSRVRRRGARPKYCPDCAPIVDREKKRDRDAATRADLKSKQAQLIAILDPMRDYLTTDMIVTAEHYIASLGPSDDGEVPIVNDQQPAGTITPGGSDDGMTTEYDDLAEELDRRRVEAIMHDWHLENPGWWRL